ncbi:MAG TPA: MBL fold metallo-hydrolase [Solirubrobacterales bacterium]|nr:MBL fold metallo-hydrolase [Solirubrobacterales bacterium]
MQADGPETVDLFHFDQPGAIAAHVMDGVIVDPGAEKTVHRLLAALGDEAPQAILLTHIHFDHAGATGRLVEEFPDVEVWVHERGAPHMIDPSRLVSSARKVFGEHFDLLWGEVVPVPERNIRILKGGEADGPWRVEYTPGHAKHHVCYLHEPTRTAFTGDVTGVRTRGGRASPPPPPPDIDPPLWHESLEIVRAWQPQRIAFQHFGQATDVENQIDMMHKSLDLFSEKARETDADGMTGWIREWLAGQVCEEDLNTYWRAGPFEGMWSGLARYWQQQEQGSRG